MNERMIGFIDQERDAFIAHEEEKNLPENQEDDFSPEYDQGVMQAIRDRDFYKKLLTNIFSKMS